MGAYTVMDVSEPKVLRVEAKDIHVVVELSMDYLRNIRKIMEMSEFNYDSTDPKQVELYNFLQEEYYPFIEGTIQGVEEQC